MPSIDREFAFGMSTVKYAVTPDKADLIENMIVTPDGTLRSMTGPTLYEPKHVWSTGPAILGHVHAIYHGYFNGGEKEVLLIHAGRNLYVHQGAKRGWEALVAFRTFRSDSEASAYSTFVPFGNAVLFSDGAGAPVVIDHQLRVTNLGFMETPSPPEVKGPVNASQDQSYYYGEGAVGYSWPGGLGTTGDRLNGDKAHILRGRWVWCTRYRDPHGNLSALSEASTAVFFGPRRALNSTLDASTKRAGLSVAGLKRGAAVITPASIPTNAIEIEIGRTKDTVRNEKDFYVVRRIQVAGAAFHDKKGDAGLVERMEPTWPTPIIDAMCVDKGSLLAVSGPHLYVSEPGFAGTWPKANKLMITADGRQGSAVFALNGTRYAATQNSITDVTDLSAPITVSNVIGIAGPKAWAYLPGEVGIVFAHKTGVYRLGLNGIELLSADIDHLWRHEVNLNRLQSTVIWYSTNRGEVRIAVSPQGTTDNKLILGFNSYGWRTYRLGIAVNCATLADDLELVGGFDGQSRTGQYTDDDVYVLEKETPLYTPPARQSIFESDYIPLDGDKGFVRGKMLNAFFGFIETYAGSGAIFEYEINFDKGQELTHTMRLDGPIGVDASTGEIERRNEWDSFLVGTDVFKDRRKTYRKARLDLSNANRFKFKLYADYPIMLEMKDFLMEFEVSAKPGNREIAQAET